MYVYVYTHCVFKYIIFLSQQFQFRLQDSEYVAGKRIFSILNKLIVDLRKLFNFQDYLRSNQLKYIVVLGIIIGLHPTQLIPPENKNERPSFLYKFYSYILVFIYISSLISCYTQLYFLCNMSEPDVVEITRCIAVANIVNVPMLMLFLIRQQPHFQKLFKEVFDIEEFFNNADDFKLKEIYEDSVNNYINNAKILTIFCCGVAFSLVYKPFSTYRIDRQLSNGLIKVMERPLPLNSWFPYDVQKHFWETYVFQVLWCVIFGLSVFFSYFVVFCVLFSAIGQLKIIHYILKNFQTYQDKKFTFSNQFQSDPAEFTFKFCIRKHQQLIRFIDTTNDALNLIIIMDFLQNSIQMTCVLVEIYKCDYISVSLTFYAVSLFTLIIYRLIALYYNSNEITVLNELLINTAYCQINWYHESKHFKFMLNMFIMRCLKPMFIKIGPFGVIGLPSLISGLIVTILRANLVFHNPYCKTSYTYIEQ
ncbi:hypothetical protein ABEB36_013939 [Hypothenemus hampei]|uniref:Odorant receptor n=1 Tax=Hypothenemus hampei TaxID=57062 RepID=A0ABD1E5R6_HYPHA